MTRACLCVVPIHRAAHNPLQHPAGCMTRYGLWGYVTATVRDLDAWQTSRNVPVGCGVFSYPGGIRPATTACTKCNCQCKLRWSNRGTCRIDKQKQWFFAVQPMVEARLLQKIYGTTSPNCKQTNKRSGQVGPCHICKATGWLGELHCCPMLVLVASSLALSVTVAHTRKL